MTTPYQKDTYCRTKVRDAPRVNQPINHIAKYVKELAFCQAVETSFFDGEIEEELEKSWNSKCSAEQGNGELTHKKKKRKTLREMFCLLWSRC